ncbi:MAG: HlyD family efflux transporter periplasmic adaptor subunit [Anaeromyxobacter sp.]
MRRVVVILGVLVVVLGGLIGLRLWTQARALAAPSGGTGEIEGTVVELASRVGARILEQPVKEGQAVQAGQLLVRLDCADPQAMLAEALARQAAAEAQASAAGAQVEVSGRSEVAAQAAEEAARAQAAALLAQAEAAERDAARLAKLTQDVPASRIDQTQASATQLTNQARAARAQAAAAQEQARAASVGKHATGAQARAALEQVRAAQAAVERAKLMVAECELRAPRAAEIQTLPHEAGELVSPGAVLVRLVDLSEVKATFYLPNAEIGAVKPGAKAEVVADAWPGQVFAGTVRTVSLEAEFTPRNIQTRTDRDRLVYPVEVVVENPGGKLRAGMPVQVTLPGTGR